MLSFGELILFLLGRQYCFVIDNAIDIQELTVSLIDRKRYVPDVTLSTEGNANLLQQLRSGIRGTFNWNKYQSNSTTQTQNHI